MLFGSSLLLVVWIIGWGVLEIPGRWIHVLPVLAVVPPAQCGNRVGMSRSVGTHKLELPS
jgi:hypothetical protein